MRKNAAYKLGLEAAQSAMSGAPRPGVWDAIVDLYGGPARASQALSAGVPPAAGYRPGMNAQTAVIGPRGVEKMLHMGAWSQSKPVQLRPGMTRTAAWAAKIAASTLQVAGPAKAPSAKKPESASVSGNDVGSATSASSLANKGPLPPQAPASRPNTTANSALGATGVGSAFAPGAVGASSNPLAVLGTQGPSIRGVTPPPSPLAPSGPAVAQAAAGNVAAASTARGPLVTTPGAAR